MKGFKIIPPKQRYMTLTEIYEAYGPRGVVAYSCKVIDSVPEGGFVIAVQDKDDVDNSGLKQYQRQLKQKYPMKAPVYYLRVEASESGQHLTVTYDNGGGERRAVPRIEIKKSAVVEAIESIPDELLAQALITTIKMPSKE